ncbi:bifunctional transcriptional activator/DNA repair enzyme AdaA [Streptomyces sp. NPDC059009]|uniref:bifunctional transcriptional activator/DNA repair enzyme AdaA n=1 Tax=Streptomyces sp. NPDC059009 TaxID=3346694 RepID=UPI00368742D7
MTSTAYTTDAERWLAVQRRDGRADGQFCYVVRTTGVYSRPSCAVRLARRENVTFFPSSAQARAAGYRPCQRCRPDEPDRDGDFAAAVDRACLLMDTADEPPGLDELARAVGYSPFHFHRMFKAFTGVTPHAYLTAGRARRVRRELATAGRVSDAIYSSGFNSDGHFYAAAPEILGMTPRAFRDGGRAMVISSASGTSSLGPVLVAVTGRGVCAVLTGAAPAALHRRLREMFPHAELAPADAAFTRLVHETLRRAEPPELARTLPVEVRTVALGERVRRLLRVQAPAAAG